MASEDADHEARVARFRPIIETELAELSDLSEATADRREPVSLDQQSVGRVSRIDALQVQATAQAVETRRRDRIARLNAALRRMAEGDYGYCAQCDEPIAERRLEVDPAAHRCIRCAR